jgi:hypothetical protein
MIDDMAPVLAPKSDQWNADDFLVGPRTVTIRDTKITGEKGSEKLEVFFHGDEGKPWRASKSMARLLYAVWGSRNNYIGKSLTLFCDPSVTFGNETPGGIRVSHMSDIGQSRTVQLTKTRGKKKPYTVQPLTVAAERGLDDLKSGANQAASNGSGALTAWWGTLTPNEKKVIKPHMDDYKTLAATKDQPTESLIGE